MMSDTASLAGLSANTATDPPLELLFPAEAPDLRQSSPHVVEFDRFVSRFGGSARRQSLLASLGAHLGHLRQSGVAPVCLLVGGGFVGPNAAPGDLDGLLAYRLSADIDPASGVAAMRCRVPGLDLRFVPVDGAPEMLIKMACFFHTLYQSRDKGMARPSFLIPLRCQK